MNSLEYLGQRALCHDVKMQACAEERVLGGGNDGPHMLKLNTVLASNELGLEVSAHK
jgi:hypothetical protein